MQTHAPAPAEQTQQQKQQSTQTSAQLFAQPQATFEDARPETAQLRALQSMMATNPQQQKMQALQAKMAAGSLVQRMEEEELLQGKFATAQRMEDEELLQGKFTTAQRMEDEELLQGKFETAQRMEDEELLQGKFETAQLMEDEEPLQGKLSETATTQLAEKPNNTGLPNQLKAGIESLSGMSMDHVKVHYNSDKPAQLNAHAYAQGSDIHMAAGQEQHLPHEAWHVVQQAQGRVKPTVQMKGGVPVNDDVGLETEADVMGAKALGLGALQMRKEGNVGMLELTPFSHVNQIAQRTEIVQMVRAQINPPVGPFDLAGLQAAIHVIDTEIAELTLDHAEVVNGFVDLGRIGNWHTQYADRIAALEALVPGVATYTAGQITGRADDVTSAMYLVIVSLGNMRGTLNKSLADYTAHVDRIALKEASKYDPSQHEGTKKTATGVYTSPYKTGIGKYDKEMGGAVVLVDENYVVVMEHYQLKHNPDIGILQAGGPFKGKKGSQLRGGWAAHVSTFAPAVLAYAKTEIAAMGESTKKTLDKARLADIDAYISITKDGNDWVINYHGNPPE